MEFIQIKETCLYVKDLDRSEHFYSDILKLTLIQKVDGRHLFYKIGSNILLIFNPDMTKKDEKLPPHGGNGSIHIAFEILKEEYQNVKNQMINNGINIIHEQTWKEDLYSFYFKDPDGNLLEVVPKGIWD